MENQPKHSLAKELELMKELDARDFDPYGSDLVVPTHEAMMMFIDVRLGYLREKAVAGELGFDDVDTQIVALMRESQLEYKRRFDEMSEEDKLYARAVQDWVAIELARRETERGFSYPQGSVASYEETIAVIETLELDLAFDDEDEALIRLAQTWKAEIDADLKLAEARDLNAMSALGVPVLPDRPLIPAEAADHSVHL